MSRVRLVFGTTNTQPVGTTDAEFEDIYQRVYKPFLKIMYKYRGVRATLHYSGTLLSWIQSHHSEFTDVLYEMISRRQVELVGGGFHDPILTMLPNSDRIGQIEMLTTFLRKRFGRRPRGVWITEQIWDPTLPATLRNAGIEYVLLDGRFLTGAALPDEDLLRPHITEDQGKTVVVLPIHPTHTGAVFNAEPDEVVSGFREVAERTDFDPLLTVFLSGEELSGRAKRDGLLDVEGGWFDRFLSALDGAIRSRLIETVVPYRELRQTPARGRISLPPPSRDVAPDRAPPLFHYGAHFRSLLNGYRAGDHLYAKMQYVHVLANQIRGDKYRKQAAREELWRGQCNVAYWHAPGVVPICSGARKAAYSALIEAEKITRESGVFSPSLIPIDFDMDGRLEYLYQGLDMNAYVHTIGGVLFELDYLPISWNYIESAIPDVSAGDTQTPDTPKSRAGRHDRRERSLLRDCAVDHLLKPESTLQDLLERSTSADFSPPLYRQEYEVIESKREQAQVVLATSCLIDSVGIVSVRKRIGFSRSSVSISYVISNAPGNAVLQAVFAPEFTLSPANCGESTVRRYSHLGKGRRQELTSGHETVDHSEAIEFEDDRKRSRLVLAFGTPASAWVVPLFLSRPDGRHQGMASGRPDGPIEDAACEAISVVPRFPLALDPGDEVSIGLELKLSRIPRRDRTAP